MESPILWQNGDKTVTLIDVPSSIAFAQGTQENSCHDRLLSSEPQQAPFSSNEPKSASAKTKVEHYSVHQELHAQYAAVLEQALIDVRQCHTGSWCRARVYAQHTPPARKKRRLSDAQPERDATEVDTSLSISATTAEGLPATHLTELARQNVATQTARMKFQCLSSQSEGLENVDVALITDHGLVSNVGESVSLLELSTLEKHTSYRFHLPPKSTFFLADCHHSRSFHHAVRAQAADQETRRDFDFILLNPPWPNRSVKRTRKTAGSTYSTLSTLSDMHDLLAGMDLDMLMADDCLVATWVTNKPAIRDLVLGEDGLFATWGVELVEEWIWLKTTVHGEPVTQLDALWRKPYEVLLLGRKRKQSSIYQTALSTTDEGSVRRRVIISVPDLHSRKPCLKELIEPMMRDRNDYRALEVFARHLVAGWWSWGDECIKFNWDGCWKMASTA